MDFPSLITFSPFLFLLWFVLPFFWFLRITRSVLFYLYLWQLKDYHLGRFIDHFRTAKGKSLLFNKLIGAKIFLLLVFLGFLVAYMYGWLSLKFDEFIVHFILGLFAASVSLFFLLYLVDGLRALVAIAKGKGRAPTVTFKTLFLTGFTMVVQLGFVLVTLIPFVESPREISELILSILFMLIGFLVFDIAVSAVVSCIVFCTQPFTVLYRSFVVQKATKKREKYGNLMVIGITGSYGKTSTKEFLAHILSQKFRVLKTLDHQNSEMGISRCIMKNLKEEHEVFVCEMGAYNKGGIRFLARIIKPNLAILCGADEQHLALFGSMKSLLSAEGGKELVEELPSGGVAILNGNNAHVWEVYENSKLNKNSESVRWRKTYVNPPLSMIENGTIDLWAEQVQVKRESVSFQMISREGDRVECMVHVAGGYNVQNLMLAAATAKELGMSLQEIGKALATIPTTLSAMKIFDGPQGLHIIESTYSANPNGVFAALDYLKNWEWEDRVVGEPHHKRILIMPSLIELGGASKKVHQEIGEKIGISCDFVIITTKDYFKELKENAEKNMRAGQIVFIEDPFEIVRCVEKETEGGDVVLLEGRVPGEVAEMLIR